MSAVVPGDFFYPFLPLFTTTTRSFFGLLSANSMVWFGLVWFFWHLVHFLVLLFSYAKLTVSFILVKRLRESVAGTWKGGTWKGGWVRQADEPSKQQSANAIDRDLIILLHTSIQRHFNNPPLACELLGFTRCCLSRFLRFCGVSRCVLSRWEKGKGRKGF